MSTSRDDSGPPLVPATLPPATESRDITTRRTRGGLGSGLRLLVPGSEMARLDVGWSPGFGFHFHFANGTKPKAQRTRLR